MSKERKISIKITLKTTFNNLKFLSRLDGWSREDGHKRPSELCMVDNGSLVTWLPGTKAELAKLYL